MDPDLMTTLRIQCLAPDDPEVEEYSGPVCPRNEAEVRHLLMSLIQAMLARCDTTVEEDRELSREGYKGDGTPTARDRWNNALALRLGEKEVLRDNLMYLKERQAACVREWEAD